MFNTATKEPYIVEPTTSHFRWGWDFNHWVPWTLQYPLQPPTQTRHMLQLKLTKPPGSLSESSTSTKRFRIFCRSLMKGTSNAIINTRCRTSFRWATNFGFTCRKKALHGLIRSFVHSFMDLTPSPRLWVIMLLISTFPPSLVCTQCSMWTSFGLIFHHYWTPRR
jgi:hypothetical protein